MEFLRALTRKNVQLMLEIEKKGSVTSRSQSTYARLGFFMNIKTLYDSGIVMVDREDEMRRKFWMLSEKGKKLLILMREVDKVWKQNISDMH